MMGGKAGSPPKMRQKVTTKTYCNKSAKPGNTENEQRGERKEDEFGLECESPAGNPGADA